MRFWPFRRRKKKRELEDLATLISAVDGFRVGRCAELKSMDRIVRKVRLTGTSKKWTSIRRDLEAIRDLPTSSPKVMFMMNLALLLRFLGLVSFTAVMMLAIMVSIGSAIEITESFTNIFVSVLIFGNVVLVVRYFVKERVKKFFDESAGRLKSKSTHLRELNQELVNRLREGIKKYKGKPRDYKLILFNSDYKDIQILKKPGILREHFVAIASE